MIKEEAKKKIADLVEKYKRLDEREIKSYNEANTRRNFVELLFAELGWSVYDRKEVSEEERASKGRVDYAFKLNGISQFYLEAKALKENLNKEEYIQQAVEYAYNKGVTWAILSNFESTHVYVAQTNKLCLNLQAANYVESFDDLWLLSRESFEANVIAEWGVRYGHLPEKQRIEDRLFQQLKQWRDALFKQIHHYNRQLTHNEINEVIQRFFNRLIFIRNCEDRKIENNKLRATLNEWRTSGCKGELIEKLQQVFHYFANPYDSDLFEPHLTDNIYIESATVEDIINGLYKVPGSIANYDFSIMEPDVLGSVYEQYLGYVTSLRKKDFEEQQEVTRKHRKEQGIYYTPTFVTNYIVKETVGHFLKDHTHNEILNMKILDPACGSGSFLIRAFDELLNYHAGVRSKPVVELDQHERLQVLLANIFGVDLDKQAVEITRLNLLLRTLTERGKLEMLENNIQRGNSLISGPEVELKNYFGKNWKDKEPFSWEDKFPDIMSKGGFDVVIGNPPWGGDIDRDLVYFRTKYQATTREHTDSFKLFIETSLRLARNGGLVSLIVPNTLLGQRRLRDARSLLMQNQILALVDLGENVFEGVTAPSCIFVVRKGQPNDSHHVLITDLNKLQLDAKIDALSNDANLRSVYEQRRFLDNADLEFVAMPNRYAVPVTLIGDFDEVICKDAGINYQRVNVGMKEKGKGDLAGRLLYEGKRQRKQDKMYWKGTDIDRYWIAESTQRYCRPDFDAFIHPHEVVRLNEDVYRIVPKILLRQTADHIIATIDYRGVWFGRSIISILLTRESDYKIEYFLALLNSRYFKWLYSGLVHETGRVFAQVKLSKIEQLPVRQIDFANPAERKAHDKLVSLVEKMLKLNRELQKAQKGLDEWHDIQKQIEQTDKKIDTLVYDLYGLTEAERIIVESAAK